MEVRQSSAGDFGPRQAAGPARDSTTDVHDSKSMGKRELVLIVGFVVVGRGRLPVHGARPRQPGERSFAQVSCSNTSGAHCRGNRASAEVDDHDHSSGRCGRVRAPSRDLSRPNLTIIGEDRRTSRPSCTSTRTASTRRKRKAAGEGDGARTSTGRRRRALDYLPIRASRHAARNGRR